jgi:RNase P/RNase MRP subunit POP5
MTKSPSIKKTTREKIVTVIVKTFEELTGHPATDKAKKQIEKKSRKISRTIVTLLKKDSRKAEKLKKATEPKEKKSPKAKKDKSKKKLDISKQVG